MSGSSFQISCGPGPIAGIVVPLWVVSLVAVLAGCLLLGACASTAYMGYDLEDYEAALRTLRAEVAQHPDHAEPLRDIGIIYLRTGYPDRGRRYLEQAFALDPDDPQILFTLGLANERLGQRRIALRHYGRYAEFPRTSRHRSLMEGRYGWLAQEVAREEVRGALAREQELGLDPGPDSVVAVFPLAYQGREERFAVLGLGLSEMITIDLAGVSSLQVVERARLDVLLDELELAETDYMDPATTPRSGRLLGAGQVVGGAYDVMAEENLRLDAAVWALGRDDAPDLESRSDLLQNLFALQKQVVYGLLERMGIELTPEERSRLEQVPTDDLQAFLAFSRGLHLERQGLHEEAALAFQEAVELDAEFQIAEDRQRRAESMTTSAGSTEAVLQITGDLDPVMQEIGMHRVNERLRRLNDVLGIGIVPNDETRSGASESVSETTRLRDPPRPPGH